MLMTTNNEWWDFHLTPSGWVQGSYQLEIGEENKLKVPQDVILTRRFIEQAPGRLSPPKKIYVDVFVKDEALAGELLRLHPFPWKYYAPFEYSLDNSLYQ